MSDKYSIKVTKLAFYGGGLVYPGEIIKNYKGEIPTWATLADGTQAKKTQAPVKPKEDEQKDNPERQTGENDTPEKTEEQEAPEGERTETIVAGDGGVHVVPVEKTEAEILEEYNTLLDEAVEKNILLEDADKKTIVEQIAELKILLGK